MHQILKTTGLCILVWKLGQIEIENKIIHVYDIMEMTPTGEITTKVFHACNHGNNNYM